MYLENDRLHTVGLCKLCRNAQSREERAPSCRDVKNDTCALGERSTWGLTGYPIASVYAPLQSFTELYDHATALRQGTLFKELDLPFEGISVTRGGCGCG